MISSYLLYFMFSCKLYLRLRSTVRRSIFRLKPYVHILVFHSLAPNLGKSFSSQLGCLTALSFWNQCTQHTIPPSLHPRRASQEFFQPCPDPSTTVRYAYVLRRLRHSISAPTSVRHFISSYTPSKYTLFDAGAAAMLTSLSRCRTYM